jgi:hypothetical protein
VRFELRPAEGVPPLRLGMSRAQARAALEPLGPVQEFARGDGPPGWLLNRQVTVFAYFDARATLEAVELAPPVESPAEDSVWFRDIDVFATPAGEVVQRLRADYGLDVREEEGGASFVVPDLVLALWRGAGGRGHRDEDGMGSYLEPALVAAPGYYD